MIPESAIIEWQNSVPWTDPAQVEQDLIICRALIEIYKNPLLSRELAFRGGTALNKLYLSPQPRYSEDIDLVQVNPGPIKPIILAVQKALSFLGKSSVEQKRNNNTLKFKFETEIAPLQTMRLKVEINCREHFNVLGLKRIPLSVDNTWYSGSAPLLTYDFNELIGTKLRALYQRKKGRDLFDLFRASKYANLDVDKVIECYRRYMEFSDGTPPTQRQFLMNMDEKMEDEDFLNDTFPILRIGEDFIPKESYEIVKNTFISRL